MSSHVIKQFYWEIFLRHCDNNISYILAAGWYYYLASTLEYLKHIYEKKLEENINCTLFTLYGLEISDPFKEQNMILNLHNT